MWECNTLRISGLFLQLQLFLHEYNAGCPTFDARFMRG
jgi:hypothetical protein